MMERRQATSKAKRKSMETYSSKITKVTPKKCVKNHLDVNELLKNLNKTSATKTPGLTLQDHYHPEYNNLGGEPGSAM
jgi:hypothetical protein